MSKVKEIEGTSILGDSRKYTFNLMNAKTGTRLFHEYVSLIVAALPLLGKFLSADSEKIDAKVIAKKVIKGTSRDSDEEEFDVKEIADLVAVLPQILTWERVEELAREMLAGHKATIDGAVHQADETGFHDGVTGDPLEIYTAIFYAITANYPKYIDPLLTALEDDESDSSQGSDEETSPPAKSSTR